MAAIGRYNSMQVVKHTGFGLYLDGGADGEILLPKRYIPKDVPSEVGDWLNVFVYLDSEDKLIATTEKPGAFHSVRIAYFIAPRSDRPARPSAPETGMRPSRSRPGRWRCRRTRERR